MDSTSVAKEVGELRGEFDEFTRGTKSILQDIRALLDRANVLNENYPPASMTISDLKRMIREV